MPGRRKKTNLSLYISRKRKRQYRQTGDSTSFAEENITQIDERNINTYDDDHVTEFQEENQTRSDEENDIYYETPNKLLKTSLGSITPKKTFPTELKSELIHAPKKDRFVNKRKRCLLSEDSFTSKCESKIRNNAMQLCSKLQEGNILLDFMNLIDAICDGSLPLDNISLLLCLERARFSKLPITSNMYYWPQTLKFWKVVYRLLQGKAIRLFSGQKNSGIPRDEKNTLNPLDSKCNFAVPSMSILRTHEAANPVPKEIKPGVIDNVIDIVSSTTKEYVLAIDGKKIAQGLDENHGDIDLWGHESPNKVIRKEQLDTDLEIIDKIADMLPNDRRPYQQLQEIANIEITDMKSKFIALGTAVSEHVHDLRELVLNQERLRDKLNKLTASNPDMTEKYKLAISKTQASVYLAKTAIKNGLSITANICKIGSHLGTASHAHNYNKIIDMNTQENLILLKNPESLEPEHRTESQLIKQRTPEWHELRASAPVTGSTLHNALGLRLMKNQNDHIMILRGDKQKDPISQELQDKFNHGIENEENALVTFSSMVVPFLYDDLYVIEDGCSFIPFKDNPRLIEVSTDGTLCRIDSNVEKVLEIKCPVETKQIPIHYKLPKYYVCQVLAEMASKNVSSANYICYTKESMTVLEVKFDPDLWTVIVQETYDIYGKAHPTVVKRKREIVPELKKMIDNFVERNVSLIIEVPSSTRKKTKSTRVSNQNSPYLFPVIEGCAVPQPITIEDIELLLNESTDFLKESHLLCRKKASEVLAFVITDTDRKANKNIPHHLPIAYGLKGYSLTNTTLRKMCDDVKDKCIDRNVNIICECFDGQWHQLTVRDEIGKPLNRLELQKDIWKECCSMPKAKQLSFLKTLYDSRLPHNNILIMQDGNKLIVNSHDYNMGRLVTPAIISNTEATKTVHKVTSTSNGTKDTATKCRRNNNPKSLKVLSHKIISAQTYPKCQLNRAISSYMYNIQVKKWEEESHLPMSMNVNGKTIMMFSKPEYNEKRNRFEPKIIDPSHLLVNNRVRILTKGTEGVKPDAFSKVCETHPDVINRSLVKDILDKQNVAHAQSVFSEGMEDAMRDNGDFAEANYTKLIREWYNAIDLPGIPAQERLTKLLNFHQYLLKGIDFTQFPPPRMYLKGMSIVQFCGFVQNTEMRIRLYNLSRNGSYNHRAIGTLAVESFFGELTDMATNGCPKATKLPMMMSHVTELNNFRHDIDNRCFYMDTKKKTVYPCKPLDGNVHESDGHHLRNTPDLSSICSIRDHYFDTENRNSGIKRRKNSKIAKLHEQESGVLPVRSLHYKKDESKIPATYRLNASMKDIEELL